jgi:RNA polymerase sigma-70 factor (ECF subfamily)
MATTLSELELTRQGADVDDLPVDKSLVLRFQMGHPEAYDEIFARYRPLAERVCMRILGDREDAQEAVQETMLRVLRGLPVFNGRYQLQAWIARIATNVSVDMVRARGRRPQQSGGLHDLGEDAVTDAAMDPERLVEQILERERVLSILDEIPPHHREALVLREFEGRSHEEIGDALGVSPAQAKALIHRAKSTFRRAWGEERHGIAAFLPWFLIPAGLRRLSGALQTLATRAAVSPIATEATASTAEKVTAAAVAVVVAGTVGVGAYAVRHVQRAPASSAPAYAAPAPSASPAPAVQEIVPPPAHPTPHRAVDKPKKHHSSTSVPPTTTPSPTTDPSPSPDPGDTSPPPVVLGPAPAWSGAFGINWSSEDVCDCGPGMAMDSSTASGQLTAETGLDIAQQLSGAAMDAEGDAAWALMAGIGAHMDASGGHLNLVFSLGGADGTHGYSGYASSPSSVTGVPGDGNPVVYSFSGSYVLEGGDPSTSPIRTSGQFLVQVSVWGDGTSVFVTQMQVL